MIEKLQPASFRGVPFLVKSETKSGGKKTVTHEYVNSNKRFTEELGELPPSFSIDAVVHGENAIQRRKDLEGVLNIPGLGDLVHPVYGLVKVKSTTFSVSSNQNSIGEYNFSIQFESTEENQTAQPSTLTKSAVSKASESARDALNNSIVDAYQNPMIPDTLSGNAETLDSIYTALNGEISSIVGSLEDEISDFNQIVETEKTNVLTTVQQGLKVKDSLASLYDSAISVASNPSDTYTAWKNLINYAIDDARGAINTVYRLNKENNRSVMNEHTRVMALINLYEAAIYVDFQTDQDLEETRDLLDETYDRLLKEFDEDIDSDNVSVLAENSDVRASIAELRVKANAVFDNKEQNIFRVVTIDPGITSLSLATFRFYGSLDNLEIIKSLNPSINWAHSDSEISAVSN